MKIKYIQKILTILLWGSLILSSCARIPTSINPPNNTIIPPTADLELSSPSPTTPASPTPTLLQPSDLGTVVSFPPLSLIVPPGLASGATGRQHLRLDSEDAARWQMTPGHTQISLDQYPLMGKLQQPQIYLYPAQEYAELVPAAFESIRQVNNTLYGSGGAINEGQLPSAPFLNAKQVFASNIEVISFQNGGGVRFLTEYAQYNAPVNNHELIYHFQGVTRDGAYYIIAILPITAPTLVESPDKAAVLPVGGIATPASTASEEDWQAYYTAIAASLNDLSMDSFSPTITQLDLLIQSIQVDSQ